MPVKFEGQLRIFVKKAFESKDGEAVEYFEAYFVGVDDEDNDQVLKINTKTDLSAMLEKHGTVSMEVQSNGKMRLLSFRA
jgi:hypothetical protein